MIWRRSKSYRQRLFRRLLFGLPVVASIGWEYRVWKRKLYYDRNREHFPGSTPFYGKMWGYESDYMIERSLDDGDLVFWSAHPLSLHLHEAMARFPYRHLKGDYDGWDFVGVVLKRASDGTPIVVGPMGDSLLYSDLVADYRTSTVAIRKLVDTSETGSVRKRLSETVTPSNAYVGDTVHVGPQGFFEYSLKAIIRSGYFSLIGSVLRRFIRNEAVDFPYSVMHSLRNTIPPIKEICDIFNDPLILGESASYSPPFFVRRLDNEYYNHNRTKNIIVDWKMLQEREAKNKMVAKHGP